MTETAEKNENAPIVTSTRVPTDNSSEEAEGDEEPESTPIATSTRVP